jgi:hypothetical protein
VDTEKAAGNNQSVSARSVGVGLFALSLGAASILGCGARHGDIARLERALEARDAQMAELTAQLERLTHALESRRSTSVSAKQLAALDQLTAVNAQLAARVARLEQALRARRDAAEADPNLDEELALEIAFFEELLCQRRLIDDCPDGNGLWRPLPRVPPRQIDTNDPYARRARYSESETQ